MASDVDSYYYISMIVNLVCCIPFVIALIIYLTRLHEFNYSKAINTMLGLIVTNDKGNEEYCTLQGSLYVSGVVMTIVITFCISILFFAICASPQIIDQNKNCIFITWIIVCTVGYFALFCFLMLCCVFFAKNSLNVCRLEKNKDNITSITYYVLFIFIGILIAISLIIMIIVLCFGEKIAKIENDYLKFKKKLRMTCIIQIISITLLLVNRITGEINAFSNYTYNKIMDLLLSVSFMLMVCINCFNQQTRDDIKKILKLTNNKEIETNINKPEDENTYNFMRTSLHSFEDD